MKYRPWAADYKPPAPPDENSNVKKTPEEIEREIKVSVLDFWLEIYVMFLIKLKSIKLLQSCKEINILQGVHWVTSKSKHFFLVVKIISQS